MRYSDWASAEPVDASISKNVSVPHREFSHVMLFPHASSATHRVVPGSVDLGEPREWATARVGDAQRHDVTRLDDAIEASHADTEQRRHLAQSIEDIRS